MSEQPGSGRLDADTIAAYLDGQLPPEARAEVEARMAADPETYEWVVNAVRTREELEFVEAEAAPVHDVPSSDDFHQLVATVDDDDGYDDDEEDASAGAPGLHGAPATPTTPPPRPGHVPQLLPFYKRRGFKIAIGGVLAAAAVLVLMVRVSPERTGSLRALFFGGSDIDPRFEKLVAAVGEERYIEGRLTGGFKYGPLRSVTRGPGDLSNQNLALLAAAGELQKAAQADPNAENLHAWGVAQLLLNNPDAAVRTLEQTGARAEPSNLADLSAAYLAAARAEGRPEFLARALDAAGRALLVEPQNRVALFNKALTLQQLQLRTQAAEAWRAYLDADNSSQWAEDAKRYLSELNTKPAALWLEHQSDFIAGRVDARVLVAASPSKVRHMIEEELLPSWASAVGNNRPAEARDALDRAHSAARALRELGGDPSILREVEDIRDADGFKERLAHKYNLLHLASEAIASYRFEEAATYLAQLLTSDDYRSAAFSTRVRIRQASTLRTLRRHREALSLIVPSESDGTCNARAADANRVRGLAFFGVGDYAAAKSSYLLAVSQFTSCGETDRAATTAALLAELLTAVGQFDDAWRHEQAALEAAPYLEDLRERLVVLYCAANLAASQALPLAALWFSEELAATALNGGNLSAYAESKATIGKRLIELGRLDEADKELSEALATVNENSGSHHQRFVSGEIVAALSQLKAVRQPREAAELVTDALTHATTMGRPSLVASLLLSRATAFHELGKYQESEADLDHAARHLDAEVEASDDPWAKAGVRQRGFPVFAARARQSLARGDDPKMSLEWMVRGADAQSDNRIKEMQRALDSTGAVVWVHSFENELRWWVLTHDEVHSVSIGIDHRSVALLVSRLLVNFKTHGRAAQATAAEGYQLLIAPIEHLIDSRDQLWFDGVGWPRNVPWAALRTVSGRYLVQEHTIHIGTPRADWSLQPHTVTVLDATNYQAAPLLEARREVEEISGIYQRAQVVSAGEGKARAMAALGSEGVVHFAGHALVDPESPSRSLLLLDSRPDSPSAISGTDLGRLRLRADVVVLTACSTARVGQGAAGLSLGSLMLVRGAKTAVATLADVSDDIASSIGVTLHRHLSQGLKPAEALARAQRIMAPASQSLEWALFAALE